MLKFSETLISDATFGGSGEVLRGRTKMMHGLEAKSIHSVSIRKVLGRSVLKYLQILKGTLGMKEETLMHHLF